MSETARDGQPWAAPISGTGYTLGVGYYGKRCRFFTRHKWQPYEGAGRPERECQCVRCGEILVT